MSHRRITFALEEFYHIYNRGTEKRTIFMDPPDYRRFTELLFLSNSVQPINMRDIREATDSIFDFDRGEQLVAIGAYCLMPNHFHILMTPLLENGIEIFMRKVSTGYSMYFNKRHERTGILFEGRYKSQHVNSDRYLKYLFSYIHLNPVKLIQPDWKEVGIRDIQKTRKFLSGYKYSSLNDYLIERKENAILDKDKFPVYFKDREEVNDEMLEWLTYETSQ